MTSLKGKNILVTGASRGIGKAIALHCAAEGANVAGLATRTANLDDTASAIAEIGGEFLALEGDISLPQTADDAIAATVEKWGSLDGLVANAGITRDNLLLRMKQEDFDAVINTNLGGSFHLLKAATKPMMRNKGGSIIFIGSVVASTGNPGQANYCAAKAGLHGLARSAAIELGSRNITVNVIAPGFIATDMTDELPEASRDALTSNIALKRLGQPEDIAGLSSFLLSSAGSYITGQVMLVDGGLSLA
ncbi:MAG: 3-oxoacyl-[acyl-carrier-protein] reductase [Planctomycetota bacterium]|jgi:3-oxoacyl-[acyl-carrier protein] reductase|nr:3-oxoacyl-[acyl-carrier-protein] reductase [Planctomycetota bacterium]